LEILKILNGYCLKYWSTPETIYVTTVSAENDQVYGALLEDRLVGGIKEKPIQLKTLIGPQVDHPGAGSYVITECVIHVGSLLKLWRSLPIDELSVKTIKKQEMCSDRSYFCDAEGWLRKILKRRILEVFGKNNKPGEPAKDESKVVVLPHMRFLHYSRAGSSLAPHTDLNRVDPVSGLRSTHSFLLYLSDCCNGGETVLLKELSTPKFLARVKPESGRLLLFPHACPHAGAVVEDVPKLLIRGEVYLKVIDKA
jgi:hypothetical protein